MNQILKSTIKNIQNLNVIELPIYNFVYYYLYRSNKYFYFNICGGPPIIID